MLELLLLAVSVWEALLSYIVILCKKPMVAAGGAWFDLGHLSVYLEELGLITGTL